MTFEQWWESLPGVSTDAERALAQAAWDASESARPEVALIREAAEIAGREWHTFAQTKEAHDRHSPKPFRFRDFGLDYDKAIYSRDCMERILALADKCGPQEGSG